MVRYNRVKNYFFGLGSMTADSAGLFDVYSDHVINGTIQSVFLASNSHTETGSVLIFASGTSNELIMRIRAGSGAQTFYPFSYATDNQNTTGSPQAFAQRVLNTQLRIVGSGLGGSTSGLGLNVNYI